MVWSIDKKPNVFNNHNDSVVKSERVQIHTFIPSSSLTLRIIFTHISVILLNAGCSRQMSLRILITRFLTLIPVSYVKKKRKRKQHYALNRFIIKTTKTEIDFFKSGNLAVWLQ